MKQKLFAVLLLVPLYTLLAPPLFAIRPANLVTRTPRVERNEPTEALRPTRAKSQPANKLRSCQAKEENIKTRSQNLTQFTSRVLTTFDKISTRVQEFYTAKGLSVPNYSTLVADITAKRLAVEAAQTKASAVLASFSCDSANPKANLQIFNQNMKLVQVALKEYKTSIRNLIVAVHSQSPGGNLTRQPTGARPTGGDQ